MFRPSAEKLIEVMQAKGHSVYDTPGLDWNLNIVGIRASDPDPGVFNDTLIVLQRFRGS
jgi:hypothetical protein